MINKILSIDLGTSMGWAIKKSDGSIEHGVESFKLSRFDGGGVRFLKFKRWLTEIKSQFDGIDAVFYEKVRNHNGIDAAQVYGGFLAHLTAWCEHHGIPYQGIDVGTIKKSATGKGNASKQDMINAVIELGYVPHTDDDADALCLLHYAINLEYVSAS